MSSFSYLGGVLLHKPQFASFEKTEHSLSTKRVVIPSRILWMGWETSFWAITKFQLQKQIIEMELAQKIGLEAPGLEKVNFSQGQGLMESQCWSKVNDIGQRCWVEGDVVLGLMWRSRKLDTWHKELVSTCGTCKWCDGTPKLQVVYKGTFGVRWLRFLCGWVEWPKIFLVVVMVSWSKSCNSNSDGGSVSFDDG